MASNVFGEGEPARKKAKRQPDDIFKTLDNQVKLRLEKSLPIICNLPNLMFLKIIFANAKSRVPFSKATCDTEEMFWPDGNEPVNCTIDNLFVEGMDILNTYLNKNKIPEDQAYQDALAKLLKFFSEGKYNIHGDPTVTSQPVPKSTRTLVNSYLLLVNSHLSKVP